MSDVSTSTPRRRPNLLTHAVGWLFDGPLLRPIVAIAAAAIVPVGPWLVSVLALSVISLTLSPVLGRAGIEDLRLAVVYAFGISLIATAPVAALAARLARRAAEERAGRLVAEIYTMAQIIAGLASQAFALVVVLGFGIPSLRLAVAFVVLTAAASLLWTSFAVLSALRRTWGVVGAFLLGTVIAIACALLTTIGTPTVEILLWCFALGLAISHHLMYSAVVDGTRLTAAGLAEAARQIWNEIVRNRVLFLGTLCAITAVWADKVIFWFSPDGMAARSGLFHFAPYDSAMFLAHLSMIPTLAAWYLFQQGSLEPQVQRFWRLIGARPTYPALAAATTRLQELVWRNIFGILFVQAVCSIVLILLAPQIARSLAMRFDQIELIQIGTVAVLLQSLYFLCSAVIMVCNRTRTFFQLNLAFLTLTLTLGVGGYWLSGVTAYPVFLASLVSAALSFVLAYRALSDFLFTIFVRENDGLYVAPPVPTPGALLARGAAAARRLARGGFGLRTDGSRISEVAGGPEPEPAPGMQ